MKWLSIALALILLSAGWVLGQVAPADPPPAEVTDDKAATADTPKPSDGAAEPKLKFNFRYQKWVDVLEWFARQADLSLVLDAPPPGTFNYTDNREYTPTEAIDLLNGVLLTKGFTLVRRERMLHLASLENGLPDGLVSQVAIADVDKRGKFEFISVIFPLEGRDPELVAKEIGPLLGSRGKAVPLPATRQLMVTDTAGVMRAIGAVIQSMPVPPAAERPRPPKPEEKPLLTVYPLKTAEPQVTFDVLKAILPDVHVAIDAKNEQLSAYATPSQHEAVKAMLEQLQANNPPDKKPQLVAYPLRNAAATLVASLQQIVPAMKLAYDATGGKLMALGTPAEHELLKKALAELGRQDESGPRLEVYEAVRGDAAATVKLLTALVPAAKLTSDDATDRVVVLAESHEHESIRATLAQLAAVPGREPRKLVIYPVGAAQRKQFEALRAKADGALASAVVVAESEPGQLAVWATAREHDAVSEALDQLTQPVGGGRKLVLVTYGIRAADPASLLKVLETLFPNVRFVLDAKTRKLAAWTEPDEQAAIEAALAQLDSDSPADGASGVVVYPLRRGDPTAAIGVLKTLVPDAVLTSDAKSNAVVASARPADHKIIADVVARLEKAGDVPAAVLRMHDTTGSAREILSALTALYANRTDVRLSLDAGGEKIVAVAPDADQLQIAKAIADLGQSAAGSPNSQIELYPLGELDASDVKDLVTAVLGDDRPRARLVVDDNARMLVAIAPPREQERIRATLARLNGTPAEVDVMQLETVDPTAAISAIERLLGDSNKRDAPRIESDITTGRLIVRGTKQQLRDVRDLLVKMGETGLDERRPGAGRTVRVIPLSVDPQAAVAEIERLWPRLRGNPVQVVSPSAVVPTLKQSRATDKPPAESKDVPPPPAADEPAEKPSESVEETKCQLPEDAPVDPPAKQPAERPPIILAPGSDHITIASDDPEALDQLEGLLRAMSQRRSFGGREFTVYPLHGASASETANLLERLFRGATGRDSISVVADGRLNALVVHAGRADQAAVKELLAVLDADEVPESLLVNKARMIKLTNAKAHKIESVIRDLYKTQLTTGGGRPSIPVTRNMPAELAAVVQQLNAAASAPMLTISVDEESNSLLVLAPGPLTTEIEQLVARLDRAAAEESSRVVKLVPLKKLGSQKVQDAIDALLEEAARRNRR